MDHLCLLDDLFLALVFEDNIPAVELVLQILLKEQELSIRYVQTQREYRNPYGHSVRMDVMAKDIQGRQFDLEAQRRTQQAPPQRLRYYSSIADSRMLKEGSVYTDLADSYTIFLMEKDVRGRGEPLYCYKRQNEAEELGDGSYLLYVNGAYEGDDPVGRLMHDFRCTRAEEMYYPVLAERVRYLKEHEEGKDFMSGVLEEWREEIEKEMKEEAEKALQAERKAAEKAVRAEREAAEKAMAEKEAAEKAVREAEKEAAEEKSKIVRRVLKNNKLNEEEVVQYFGLTPEEVRKLSEQEPA